MLLWALAAVTMHEFTSQELSDIAKAVCDRAVVRFASKKLTAEQLGVSVAEVDPQHHTFVSGSFQGEKAMYPASVVKLFYLAYACDLIEHKKLALTPEFERAVRDMIVESVNDATGLVLETITQTTGGPELPPKELEGWMRKRQAVNEWFAQKRYQGVNACQKTWNEGPYGRERQGYGKNFELRNSLTPNACVRLMAEIATDKIVGSAQCSFMRHYLSRTILADDKAAGYQSREFTGKVLPSGSKLFSKAGYTDSVRHDVAYFVLPDNREFVFAIFTKGQSDTADLIPSIAAELLRGLRVSGVNNERPK